MPFYISLLLMQNEFKKPALPLAIDEIRELIRINLLPVKDDATPENNHLIVKATDTEEPTAAVYPVAKSLVV
jgi:hypothetical protein